MEAVFLDIESIPNQQLPEGCQPEFDEATVKLGALKDRFKIQEKIDAARAQWEASLDKKMSLDPDLCQVCCFVGLPDAATKISPIGTTAVSTTDEVQLICDAWEWINMAHTKQIPVVTFNGLSFDIPVLIRRAMYLDVYVPPHLIAAMMDRYGSAHIDLMQLLALRNPFSGKLEVHGLDYYLKRFRLGSKNGMSGADVYPFWKEGKLQEILDYCESDVVNTAKLFDHVAPWLIQTKKVTWQNSKDDDAGDADHADNDEHGSQEAA